MAGTETNRSRANAEELDSRDELAAFRDRFVRPDDSIVYLDGNSLGMLPKVTAERLSRVVQGEWGDRLIRSWDEGWSELPSRLGDLIGRGLLGARAGEVIVCDSTTTNFYKLCSAAADARRGRNVIVTDRDNFPTDRYVIEGIAEERDLHIRWLNSGEKGPEPADVAAALADDVALVSLSHVGYRTAAIAEMGAITELAHERGALTVWDLCHSAGSVPIDLTACGADLAVGCTYKYLNGGPGAPAFLYVREELQGAIRQPILGWWGRRDMFEMAQGYEPEPGIRSFLAGTPPILSLAAVEDGVAMVLEAGVEGIRAKGIALTEYAIGLLDEWLAPHGFSLGSPRDQERRGSHVLVLHEHARELCQAMINRRVVPDFRSPNGIRLGLSPLTTRFVDVFDGMRVLAELVER